MNPKTQILYDRLENRKSNLLTQLYLSKEKFSMPEKEGKWSINQVLVHLYTSEQGTCGYLRKKMQSKEVFKRQNIEADLRFALLSMAIKLPIKYRMPKVLLSPSNEMDHDTVLEKYEESRSDFKNLLDEFPEHLVNKLIFKHPVAGRLSLTQTLSFLINHFDHHVRQIGRIQRTLHDT